MASVSDYAMLQVKDPFFLDLGVVRIEFVVDGKSFKRKLSDESVDETPRITGSSPLALMDAPFAMGRSISYAEPTSARKVVEDLIGPVTWNILDWVIPVDALIFEGSTPLQAVRKVVEAVGAMVESDIDGTPICRRLFPVSVPDYTPSVADKIYTDSDILGVDEVISPSSGFNRVSVSNGTSTTGVTADTLDQISEEGNITERVVRAYLYKNRPVQLVHTGNPATQIIPLGLRDREETERVEFLDGRASTRYKVKSIITSSWRVDELGEVTASGNNLYSAVPSYSLLDITYAVESLDFLVRCENIDEVQFYLADL